MRARVYMCVCVLCQLKNIYVISYAYMKSIYSCSNYCFGTVYTIRWNRFLKLYLYCISNIFVKLNNGLNMIPVFIVSYSFRYMMIFNLL